MEAKEIIFIDVNKKLPEINGSKQLLIFDGFQYEIGRYNEWGFHYGTRDTQNIILGVILWAELPNAEIIKQEIFNHLTIK